jgi:uncharacterized protein
VKLYEIRVSVVILSLNSKMKIQAFQAQNLSESVVSFAQFCRTHGLNIGIQESQDALQVANLGLLLNKVHFQHSLKSIFCTSPEERSLYDGLFKLFWDTNPIDLEQRKDKTTVRGQVSKKANSSLVMLGQGKSDESTEEDAKNVSGANESERLKKTDFSKISEVDASLLEEIAEKLFKEMAIRMRKKMKNANRDGKLNLRKTIRKSLSYGGEPLDLIKKQKKPKKQRLIVLLDVSGSMDKYSFYLLRFVKALSENFRQIEAFIFSTSLIRITKALKIKQLGTVLDVISSQAENWSSGTKIGECIADFNEKYGKRTLNGSPIVIILSDGLDSGNPEILSSELTKISLKAKKLVWLNPLKGMKGYEPTARGMSAALPLIDDFRSGHNLESLLLLENILMDA